MFSHIGLALALLLAILLLGRHMLSIIAVLLLMLLAVLSLIWKRITHISFGIELITFATVVYAVSFNLVFAVIAAIFMCFLANYLAGRVCMPMFVQMLGYVVVAILAYFLRGMDVAYVGKICVIVFNLLIHFIYVFVLKFRLENSILAGVINIVVNFWLFEQFSGQLISLV
jgi:hypothetical protein